MKIANNVRLASVIFLRWKKIRIALYQSTEHPIFIWLLSYIYLLVNTIKKSMSHANISIAEKCQLGLMKT